MSTAIFIIVLVVFFLVIPIAKDVISDIDYKRQLSGKIPFRSTSDKEEKRVIDENVPSGEMDSIAAQARSERISNNTHIN